jgi:sugar phosphate isomerase/epimerase
MFSPRRLTILGLLALGLCLLPEQARGQQKPSDGIMIAISTASFDRLFHMGKTTLIDFVEVCARAGLEAIELNDLYLKGDQAVIRQIKQKADRLGLGICAVAAETNYYRATPAEIEQQRRYLEQYIQIASYLGSPLLRVDTSPYNKTLPAAIIPKGVTNEMAFSAAVRTFRSVIPVAEKYGITLAVENHGGISRTSADQIKLVKAVGSKWFCINLDTGNYHADPMAGTDPFEDFLEATQKVAPYLAHCHAKIWDVTDDLREPTLDYDRFFALLRKIGYRGAVSIEYMGKKDVMEMLPKCVALLKRCRAQRP